MAPIGTARAQGDPPGGAPGGALLAPSTRVHSIVIGDAPEPQDEPSLLPLTDEQHIGRARDLVRVGRLEQAEVLIADVETRFPDDLDVLLARTDLLARANRLAELVTFIESRGKRAAVAKQLKERPSRAGFWDRANADALAALGRSDQAAVSALRAWERSPEQAAWARTRVEAWSGDRRPAMQKELTRMADRQPEREDLALEAARLEALSGRIRPAIERVKRWESGAEAARASGASGAKDGERDQADADSPRGLTLWQLALLLRSRGDAVQAAADSVLGELLTGGYDPRLEQQAMQHLFEDRVAGLSEGVTPDGVWIEGDPRTAQQGGPDDAARARAAESARLAGLEKLWRGLPNGPRSVSLGLLLSQRLEAMGDRAAGRRVAQAALSQAGRVPGAGDDPEVRGELALQRAEAALAREDFAAAQAACEEAAAGGAPDRVREEATFERAEVQFYAGQFDSAAAAYEEFARAFPGNPHANDALDRVYLIEGGQGGTLPGMTDLAHAALLMRLDRVDEALIAAQAAERLAAGGPVAAHAGLLVVDVFAAQGHGAEAAERAKGVAEALPDDRLAPVARRRAGDLYRAGGDDAKALAQYDELLVRYPRSWLAPETRRLATALRTKVGAAP